MLLNFKPKSLIVLLLFSSSSLCFSAPIVDPNAPIQFRPDVLNLPNNVTVLGIPTPNASGISHMKFKEFSVYANESLIWNNSIVSGNSVLGGLLQGNANLFSSGPASTILNEVTWLGLPSQLDGKFEIFGQKANLIIANPNGISVNGARFFNTSALNLIAGAPIVNGSQIKYNTTGNINIGSVGLDARDTEALNLIAQEINNRGSLRGPDLAPVPKALAIVDLSTLQPDITPGRIFVPVDAEGKVIKPPVPKDAITADNIHLMEITKDGRIQLRANKLENTGSIEGENNVYVEAHELSNSGNISVGKDLVIASNLTNTGSISSGNNSYLVGDWLLNRGSISVDNNLNAWLYGSNQQVRLTGDRRLQHFPDGPPRQIASDFETIAFSLWNDGGSILSDNDAGFFAPLMRNSNGDILSFGAMSIFADSLNNERTGFYTQLFPEFQEWRGEYNNKETGFWQLNKHYYTYWIDKAGSGREAYIGASGDLHITATNTHNKASLIESGANLNVKGGTFTNEQAILQTTQKDRWKRGGTNPKWREVYRNRSTGNVQSGVFAADNADFDVTRSFNNNGLIDVGGDLSIKSPNIMNGINDPNVKTPPVKELPEKLILPNTINFGNSSLLGREIKSELFNRVGINGLNDEWRPMEILKWLEENAEKAKDADSSLQFNQSLTEEQIAKLKEPIIWYERSDSGIPNSGQYVVYFPPDWDGANLDPIGIIQAQNIALNAGKNGKVKNTGTVAAEDTLQIKAGTIENERRTANATEYVKVYGGWLGGGSKFVPVNYLELQPGGIMLGNTIVLEADQDIINKGGVVRAGDALIAVAPKITNEVAEGERVVTWYPGNLGKLIGMQSYDIASVYAPGLMYSGGVVYLEGRSASGIPSSGEVRNIGSDIIAQKMVAIATENLIEQDWVSSHHTVNDSLSLVFFSVKRNKETEHVTRGSTIAALDGDVSLTAKGTFRNTASDVLASNDINIKAKTVEIKDAIEQSQEVHGKGGFGQSGKQVGWNYSETKSTKTTHQSSNLAAGNNLNISADENVEIIGSNLIAGNKLSISGEKIDIKAGEYTNKQETRGFGVNIGWTGGTGTGINASIHEGSAQQQVLNPSNLIGKEVSINARQEANIQASNITGTDSVETNTPKLSVQGQEAAFESEMNSGSIGANVDARQGGFTVNGSFQRQETEGAQYVSSSINSPKLTINAGQQEIDGANINGQAINPHSDWSETNAYGGGVLVNPFTGQVGFSGNFNEYSLFGSAGPNGFSLGGGYNNFTLGVQAVDGRIGPQIGYQGIGTLGLMHSTTEGSSKHSVWSPQFNLFGVINGGAVFQEGHYNGSAINLLDTNIWHTSAEDIIPFNYTCFPAGTKITLGNGSQKAIEKLKTEEIVLSFNESTHQLQPKPIEKIFKRKAKKLLRLNLSDGSSLEPTHDHPFWLKGYWIEASKLLIGDKLLKSNGQEVEILSIEEVIDEITVYNFKVKDNHNYFAENILVHNADYDEKYVVLQGSAFKSLDKSLRTGRDVIQSIDELIRITQNNPNLSFMQQMYFSNKLYQQRLEALFLIPSGIISLKNPTNIALKKTINEINEAQRQAILKSTESIASDIYQAVLDMGEFPSTSPPSPAVTRNGRAACAWAVNQVLNHAGIDTVGGAEYLAVKAVERDLRGGRGIQIAQTEAKAGDITLIDSGGTNQHIGICLTDGCTQVKSNSSTKAAFRWISGAGFDGYYGNAIPRYYRVIRKSIKD